MAEPAEGLQIHIDDDGNEPTVDPISGASITPDEDGQGGVVVQLHAGRKKQDGEDDPFYQNLTDKIDAQTLSRIGNDLADAIEADDRSRGQYLEIRRRGLELLGLEIKEPRANAADTSAAIEGQSTVTNPLLLEAVLKGWANAQAELLPSEGPTKISDEDNATVAEDELAEAFERDMNYYLTTTATEYYPDTSHMLLWGTYFGGSGFKKIYRCPMRRRPVSESVDAKDLIVSDTTKDLRSCSRVTHQIEMRPSVMKRMQLLGAYRDIKLAEPTISQNAVSEGIAQIQGTQATPQRPEDRPYNLWETQCEIDLPEFAPGKFKNEGIPLPYLVTIDKDSKEILSIRRDWREDDEEAERKRMYVKYPYVPGPGFYGTGMLNILGNSSMAMTAAWREALDAGMYANFPSGVIAKIGNRQNSVDLRMAPGIFQPIETNNLPIGQIIQGLPYKDVTPGLLALIDKITAQAKSAGGAADTPTAEGVQNVPVGTMLAQIEQATKVMSAAFKGMHSAQAEEIELLIDLFRDNPEDFWKSNKICPKDYWDQQKFELAIRDCNLVPRSDPNTPSHIHRVAKGVALAQLIAIPQFAAIMDARETLTRIMGVIREDATGIIIPPQPQAPAPPDPQTINAAANLQKAQTAAGKAQADAQNAQQTNQIKQAEIAAEQNVATVNLAKEMVIHGHDAQKDAQQAGLGVAQHQLDVSQAAHDRQMDVAEHALNVAQAQHDANNPAPLQRAMGGRVIAESIGGHAIGAIIASTVKQLRDAETAATDANNSQLAAALGQFGQTMRDLRDADSVAAKTVNANTFAAINRLAHTLKTLSDKQDAQPQTMTAITELSSAIRDLREADAAYARTNEERAAKTVTQLSGAIRDLREKHGDDAATATAMAKFEDSLQTMRAELQRRPQPSEPTDGNAALAEQMRRFVELQTAPRSIVRDKDGRATGVRIDVPPTSTPPADVNVNADKTVTVKLKE